MKTLAVGLVNCAVLVESHVIPTRATKHNALLQRLPLLRRLDTGNTGLALGSRRRQRRIISLDIALEVRGVAMLRLLLLSAAAVWPLPSGSLLLLPLHHRLPQSVAIGTMANLLVAAYAVQAINTASPPDNAQLPQEQALPKSAQEAQLVFLPPSCPQVAPW